MTVMFGLGCRGIAVSLGVAPLVVGFAATAQQPEHPHLTTARADVLRLVPDATDIKLTRPGCSQDANVRCMVCVVATVKGQQRIGAVVVRQADVEDNTFDPRQSPMSKDAEAGLRAACKLQAGRGM
ncbi:MAG TPA: hypothetical protein VJ890_04130 [Vineibacter sp.]|nr:hypothetical protein [Vineibacter sp.]